MFSVNKLREEWAFAVWKGIFVLVLAFGLFGHYMVEPRGYKWNFWNYWEVGALGSTIVFNVLFYILGFFLPPKMFLSLKNPSFIGVVVIFELISIGCLGWATYISLEERSCLLQLLAMLIVAMSFWALDSVMAHQSKNTDIGNDFRATVRLSDAPALVAFGVLFVFSTDVP